MQIRSPFSLLIEAIKINDLATITALTQENPAIVSEVDPIEQTRAIDIALGEAVNISTIKHLVSLGATISAKEWHKDQALQFISSLCLATDEILIWLIDNYDHLNLINVGITEPHLYAAFGRTPQIEDKKDQTDELGLYPYHYAAIAGASNFRDWIPESLLKDNKYNENHHEILFIPLQYGIYKGGTSASVMALAGIFDFIEKHIEIPNSAPLELDAYFNDPNSTSCYGLTLAYLMVLEKRTDLLIKEWHKSKRLFNLNAKCRTPNFRDFGMSIVFNLADDEKWEFLAELAAAGFTFDSSDASLCPDTYLSGVTVASLFIQAGQNNLLQKFEENAIKKENGFAEVLVPFGKPLQIGKYKSQATANSSVDPNKTTPITPEPEVNSIKTEKLIEKYGNKIESLKSAFIMAVDATKKGNIVLLDALLTKNRINIYTIFSARNVNLIEFAAFNANIKIIQLFLKKGLALNLDNFPNKHTQHGILFNACLNKFNDAERRTFILFLRENHEKFNLHEISLAHISAALGENPQTEEDKTKQDRSGMLPIHYAALTGKPITPWIANEKDHKARISDGLFRGANIHWFDSIMGTFSLLTEEENYDWNSKCLDENNVDYDISTAYTFLAFIASGKISQEKYLPIFVKALHSGIDLDLQCYSRVTEDGTTVAGFMKENEFLLPVLIEYMEKKKIATVMIDGLTKQETTLQALKMQFRAINKLNKKTNKKNIKIKSIQTQLPKNSQTPTPKKTVPTPTKKAKEPKQRVIRSQIQPVVTEEDKFNRSYQPLKQEAEQIESNLKLFNEKLDALDQDKSTNELLLKSRESDNSSVIKFSNQLKKQKENTSYKNQYEQYAKDFAQLNTQLQEMNSNKQENLPVLKVKLDSLKISINAAFQDFLQFEKDLSSTKRSLTTAIEKDPKNEPNKTNAQNNSQVNSARGRKRGRKKANPSSPSPAYKTETNVEGDGTKPANNVVKLDLPAAASTEDNLTTIIPGETIVIIPTETKTPAISNPSSDELVLIPARNYSPTFFKNFNPITIEELEKRLEKIFAKLALPNEKDSYKLRVQEATLKLNAIKIAEYCIQAITEDNKTKRKRQKYNLKPIKKFRELLVHYPYIVNLQDIKTFLTEFKREYSQYEFNKTYGCANSICKLLENKKHMQAIEKINLEIASLPQLTKVVLGNTVADHLRKVEIDQKNQEAEAEKKAVSLKHLIEDLKFIKEVEKEIYALLIQKQKSGHVFDIINKLNEFDSDLYDLCEHIIMCLAEYTSEKKLDCKEAHELIVDWRNKIVHESKTLDLRKFFSETQILIADHLLKDKLITEIEHENLTQMVIPEPSSRLSHRS